MRRESGQSTVEYIAAVMLVALVVSSAAALTPGGIGAAVFDAYRRAICAVGAGPCPARPTDEPDLAACTTRRSSKSEGVELTLGVVQLGEGLSASITERSDGTASVAFTDGTSGGVTGGVGASFRFGGASTGLEASIRASLEWNRGRSWNFGSVAQARDFLDRYGGGQTVGGRAVERVEDLCFFCDWVARAPREADKPLPEPDERWLEGGGGVSAGLTGAWADVEGTLAGALGRSSTRAGASTWYVKLSSEVAGVLSAVAGLRLAAGRSGVVALQLDADGQPVGLRATLAGTLAGGRAQSAVRRSLQTAGRLAEQELSLDLRDERDGAITRAFMTALGPGGSVRLAGAAAALARRLREEGTATVRTYRLREGSSGFGGSVAAGLKLGGGFDSSRSEIELEDVRTRLPGLPWMIREDCLLPD